MSVVAAVRSFLERHSIAGPVVVACSGGGDSTALLLAFTETATPFSVAHVNHRLRGTDSDQDEAFVRELCAQLGVAIDVADGTLDPGAIRHRGIEAAARDVRQERLREMAIRRSARWIATAHQKNDQAETVLMRIVTGTGLAGLRGIHPIRDDGFIRPLLDVSRDEIDAFLAERRVTPRFDASNADSRFLRNRIRATLEELGPAAVDNVAAIAGQAQAIWPAMDAVVCQAERRFTRLSADETRFTGWPEDRWLRQAVLQRQIRRLDPGSRDVSSRDLERLASQLDSIRRVTVTKTIELIARGGEIILRRIPEPVADFEFAITPGQSVMLPTGVRVTVRANPETPKPGNPETQLFQLPPHAQPSFTFRNRRPGDRFQPLGMRTDKKLKDFLIDRKIAAEIRDSLPLLLQGDAIVWVAGVEISERFKVTSPAGELYEVVLEHDADDSGHDGLQR